MNFLCSTPSLENLRIRSKNLEEISNLGKLQYLDSFDVDSCNIKYVGDYPSYLKLIKLYSRDQENTDSHHFYYVKLLIGNNPFDFIPHISKYYPMPSLKALASQSITFNDLDDNSANMLLTTVKLDSCCSCKQIRFLNNFYIKKAIGLIIFYVKTKLCYKCLVEEYKTALFNQTIPFATNFNKLIGDLNKIIERELLIPN
jgi:hypothetical protein